MRGRGGGPGGRGKDEEESFERLQYRNKDRLNAATVKAISSEGNMVEEQMSYRWRTDDTGFNLTNCEKFPACLGILVHIRVPECHRRSHEY
jgi:hypothetical protein